MKLIFYSIDVWHAVVNFERLVTASSCMDMENFIMIIG